MVKSSQRMGLHWSPANAIQGEYEFDYKYQHNDSEVTNVAAQSSTIYPSSSVAVTQSSIEDLNAQCQGLDVGTSRERGRKVILLIPRQSPSVDGELDV